jgi:hypothetical protein
LAVGTARDVRGFLEAGIFVLPDQLDPRGELRRRFVRGRSDPRRLEDTRLLCVALGSDDERLVL